MQLLGKKKHIRALLIDRTQLQHEVSCTILKSIDVVNAKLASLFVANLKNIAIKSAKLISQMRSILKPESGGFFQLSR